MVPRALPPLLSRIDGSRLKAGMTIKLDRVGLHLTSPAGPMRAL